MTTRTDGPIEVTLDEEAIECALIDWLHSSSSFHGFHGSQIESFTMSHNQRTIRVTLCKEPPHER